MDMLRNSGQLPTGNIQTDLSVDSSDKVQSDFQPGHKRSASAESFNSSPGETKKSSSGGASKENNFRPEQKSISKYQSFSHGSNKQGVNPNLLSATNEQKIGIKNPQQLPSKLLSSSVGSISTSSQSQTGLKSGAAGNQSSPSLTQESGSHGNGGQMGHSSSTGQLGQPANQNQYGSSTTVPMGSYSSNRPKIGVKAGISGVLKLAEKSDKKSKSGSSSHVAEKGDHSAPSENPPTQQRPKSGSTAGRNPNVNHKPQKSDSDVLYL